MRTAIRTLVPTIVLAIAMAGCTEVYAQGVARKVARDFDKEFESIQYNLPIKDTAFDFEFPENAVVFRWDLSAPGLSVEEARRKMNFELRMPSWLPSGHSIGKIIKSPHCLPAVVINMNRGASWLSLTETRHVAGVYEPRGKRVAIGKHEGYLTFLGTFSTVTWVDGNTQLTLTGNISFPKLLKVAASVN